MSDIEVDDWSLRTQTYSPGLRQPRHAHDFANITVITGGQLVEATETGVYRAGTFSVVIKPAGCEHETSISGHGARALSLRISPEDPLAVVISARGWRWIETPAVVRGALALQRALARGGRAEVRKEAKRFVSLVTSAPTPQRGPEWVDSVRQAIAEEAWSRHRLVAIAEATHLHPTYVSRAFAKYHGQTLRHYIREVRLLKARQQLSGTTRGLDAIAAETGFADASHLCRVFAAAHGVTPRQYRDICSRS